MKHQKKKKKQFKVKKNLVQILASQNEKKAFKVHKKFKSNYWMFTSKKGTDRKYTLKIDNGKTMCSTWRFLRLKIIKKKKNKTKKIDVKFSFPEMKADVDFFKTYITLNLVSWKMKTFNYHYEVLLLLTHSLNWKIHHEN